MLLPQRGEERARDVGTPSSAASSVRSRLGKGGIVWLVSCFRSCEALVTTGEVCICNHFSAASAVRGQGSDKGAFNKFSTALRASIYSGYNNIDVAHGHWVCFCHPLSAIITPLVPPHNFPKGMQT